MYKISVIIPIYGVESYIERCARSLFEQTLDDIEYIFVNDCTKDCSIEILESVIKEYPDREPHVRLLKHDINKGLPQARKTGIMEANGLYFAHCDSDDWPEPTMYEKMYNKAIEEDYDIVYCDYYRSTDTTRKWVRQETFERLLTGPVWNKIVKKSICKDHYIIYPIANKAEDGALMIQYSYYAEKRGYVSEPLYNYYVNENSMTRIMREEDIVKKLNQEVENTDLRIRFLRHHKVEHQYEKEIARWKYKCRWNLLPLISKNKYYKIWRNTYPEIDTNFYICKVSSIKSILFYFFVRFRLYGIFNPSKVV